MKQKSYKLEISKNKTVIKEAGPSQYGTAGIQAASQLIKTGGEALKMTGAFLKRSWGATFGYMITIYKSIRSHGVINGLAVANKQFVAKDKQIKNEMKSLIKAQPGARDAELFMGMTCPAARAFDVFVDKDFKDLELPGSSGKSSTERDRKKYKSFYNFVMAVSHISHNTPLNTFKENSTKLTKRQIEKKVKKKYKIDKTALKNMETKEFIEVCKVISLFYKPTKKIRDLFKEENSIDYFTLTTLQNSFVKFISENPNKKLCLNFIKENDLETSIESLSNVLALKDSIACIKHILKISSPSKEKEDSDEGKEKDSGEAAGEDSDDNMLNVKLTSGFSRLILNKDITIIKEENEDEEESSETAETDSKEKIDLKSSMALSFTSFYIMRSSILSLLSDITVSVPIAINKATDAVFTSMLSEENSITTSAEEESSVTIGSNIEKVNKQIEAFNSKFEFDIEKIDASILKELQDFATKITKEVEKSEAELENKVQNEEEKNIARSTGLIEVLENLKSGMGDLKISSNILKSINQAKKIIEDDLIELKNLDSLIENNKGELSKLGLSENTVTDILNRVEKVTNNISELNDIENKIISYTDKIEQLKSNVEENTQKLEDEKEQDKDSGTESVEIPAEKLDSKEEK